MYGPVYTKILRRITKALDAKSETIQGFFRRDCLLLNRDTFKNAIIFAGIDSQHGTGELETTQSQNGSLFSLESCILAQRKKRLRHPGFPGGLPSKYWPGATMLNFGDQTRTGVFMVLWP
jgi:hypothetical protein